jgi:hydrogenase maturation protease
VAEHRGGRSGAPAPVLVIGIGNALRGDDAAGLLAARRLRERARAGGVVVREQEGEAIGLIEQWADAEAAVLIDAVRSGAPPGTIHRVDASREPVPALLAGSYSTHAIGVGEAIELARELGRLPGRLVLYGIEGLCFEAGAALSQEVAAVLDELADTVLAEAGVLAS